MEGLLYIGREYAVLRAYSWAEDDGQWRHQAQTHSGTKEFLVPTMVSNVVRA